VIVDIIYVGDVIEALRKDLKESRKK